MATLTGQYISQSYQGLINLSTNTGIVAGTMTQLQDGAGTNLGVFFNGQGIISGSSVTSSKDSLINNISVGRGGGNVDTNTILGRLALPENTTGTSNIAIGRSALRFNTTGIQNVAVGRNTLAAATTGSSNNTAIGYQALSSNLASNNTAVGSQTLQSNTTGGNNTAVGYQAMFANTTGADNIAIGNNALDSNTTGIRSIAIGVNALQAGTTVNNVAIGFNALYSNTTGADNIGIGEETLFNNTSGIRNMAYGDSALTNNTSGGNNIALGINSLRNNVSGDANIAIGSDAGYNLATGSNNIIIGYAMTGSTTMNDQILIGINAVPKAHYISSNWNFYDGLTVVSGSNLNVHGNNQFHGAEFWSTTSQSGSAGVSGSITFNNTGVAFGVSVVSNSRLTVTNAGVYNIQFSAQIETSAGADTMYVWFKKNGNNISDSATKVVLANNTAQVMTVNILDQAATNDYYEIAYQTVNGNATVKAEAASGNIPAIPSVIATLTQVR